MLPQQCRQGWLCKRNNEKNWGCACISGTTASGVRVTDVIPNSNVILSVKTRQIKVDRESGRLKTMTQIRRGGKMSSSSQRRKKEREKVKQTKMKGGTKSGDERGRAKTQIGDNQAWGSCAKFTAVIWNPTDLASGWRERHNRFSFARNRPCSVGVSVTASFSPSSSSSSSLYPARCANETCVTRQAAYLLYTWAASLEDTSAWGIISIVEGKKGKCELIDPADKEKDVSLAFSVKPLLNCCPISDFIKVQFVAMLFPSKHANVLRGIC